MRRWVRIYLAARSEPNHVRPLELPESHVDIWSADKLVLFIAFVVPGFVSIKTYELLSSGGAKEPASQIVDAVAYSSVNYALLLWPIFEVESHNVRETSPTWYILFYVFVLLVAPISWAALLCKLRETQFLQRSLPHPTARPWDYVFSQRTPHWVIVTLKDGKKIAGKFDSRSFASSAPSSEQLYLEETWVLNDAGGFERPRVGSAGILILSTEIASVELFLLTRGGSDAKGSNDPSTSAGGKGVAATPGDAAPTNT